MGEVQSTRALRHISLSYNNADSYASALRLVLTLFPDWEHTKGQVEFIRFKDGITNTLLKAIKRRPGYSEEQIDVEAVLIRAYGKGTEVLIDRERETISHSLLAEYNLAPALLARFQNGLMYRFIRGRVCQSQDLTQEPIWRGVAQRIAQWHAVLPVVSTDILPPTEDRGDYPRLSESPLESHPSPAEVNAITPDKPTPNIWTVIQKWIYALPTGTEAETKRKSTLQKELERTVADLGNVPGLGENGLVFGHCDLLSGNVIIQPFSASSQAAKKDSSNAQIVSFIDYEYATPSPAAFDIANHFAEWGGFECDYSALPTRSTRRAFLQEYLQSYHLHHEPTPNMPPSFGDAFEAEVTRLLDEVDRFRGIPGLYWGIWALIQATISQIDFDYASYAEVRLAEYWACRAVEGGQGIDKIDPKAAYREKRMAEE